MGRLGSHFPISQFVFNIPLWEALWGKHALKSPYSSWYVYVWEPTYFLWDRGIFYSTFKWCKIDLKFVLHLAGIKVVTERRFPLFFGILRGLFVCQSLMRWMQYFLLYLWNVIVWRLMAISFRELRFFLTLPCSVVLYVHFIYLTIAIIKYKLCSLMKVWRDLIV